MDSRRIRSFIAAAVLGAVALLQAAAALGLGPLGRPAVESYSPGIEVYPANFALEQGPDGIVYIGNARGVLVFDGERWALWGGDADDLVRSLAHDGGDRLYVGGYNAFGYYRILAHGRGEYVDLAASFGIDEPNFADIWQIEITPLGVFFVALNDVFLYRPATGETERWQHEGRFGALLHHAGRTLLQYRGEGLREYRDGAFVPVTGTEALSALVYELLPLDRERMVATSRDGRWWLIDGDGARPWMAPPGLPDSSRFTAARVLRSGLLALGANDGWLYVLEPDRGRYDAFRISHDWIADLEETPEGGLLAQTDHETLYVRWPARLSAWTHDHGLTGSVLEVLRWQDRWLVISGRGAMISRPGDHIVFDALPWTDFEAWDFEPLADGTGLLADSYQVRHVDLEHGELQRLEAVQYPLRILASLHHRQRYYVGTREGVFVIRRGAEGFEIVDGPLDREMQVYSMVETAPDRLLLGTAGKGVVEVSLTADGGFGPWRPAGDGIDPQEAAHVDLVRIDGEVHALTDSKIWRRDGARFEEVGLHGLDALRRPGQFVDLRQAPNGDLWAWEFNRLHRYSADAGWTRIELGSLLRGAISSVGFDDAGRTFIGASGSIVIHDPEAPELPPARHRVLLRSVRMVDSAGTRMLANDRDYELPSGRFSISFEIALPGLAMRDKVRYQARLAGLEGQFTEWESTSRYTYSNLQPGSYAFEVRARDPWGEVTEIESFRFAVVPPWYQAPWVRNLRWPAIGLTLALLIWALMRARMWRLEVERRRLAEKVRKRTQALVQANRKLRQMADLDGLTGIANRRRFDQYLEECLRRAHERGEALAVALIDLDNFKPYNDLHGHLAGDRVLQHIAQRLQIGFGNDDRLVARFGGDEFAAVLPGVEREQARRLAEAARAECAGDDSGVEVSIGIGWMAPGQIGDSAALLEVADRELYRIKGAGRNGVSLGTVGPAEG